EDPDLDADDTVGRLGFRRAVIDVGTQRVQRHPALAVPLGARDVGAAPAARNVHADAARAHADRRLHGALHGPAEGDAPLERLGDALGDEVGVRLGLAHLDNIDVDLAVGELLHL